MMTLLPFPDRDALRGMCIPIAGWPATGTLRLLPAAPPSEQSPRRWHAGEASAYSRTSLVTRSAVVPIGGEEPMASWSPSLNAFFELAGGKGSRIMLLPASGDPRDVETYRRLLIRRGALVDIGLVAVAEDADDSNLTKRLTSMSGLFIAGGAHEEFQWLLSGTRLAEAIRAANERGLVVAGCGTAASLLGRHRIPADLGADALTGLGLLDDVIIDRHVTSPGRIEQVLAALAARPNQLVFCLKEQTALIITPDRMARVIGERSVIVIDGRPATSDLRDAVGGGVPTVTGARLHLLAPGRVFDLDRGRVADLRRGPIGRPVG